MLHICTWLAQPSGSPPPRHPPPPDRWAPSPGGEQHHLEASIIICRWTPSLAGNKYSTCSQRRSARPVPEKGLMKTFESLKLVNWTIMRRTPTKSRPLCLLASWSNHWPTCLREPASSTIRLTWAVGREVGFKIHLCFLPLANCSANWPGNQAKSFPFHNIASANSQNLTSIQLPRVLNSTTVWN